MTNQTAVERAALVLAAAGTGSRFGSETPKQFLLHQGRPVYLRSLDVFVPFVAEAVIVVHHDWIARVKEDLEKEALPITVKVEEGADTRQASVGCGLTRLDPGIEIVMVHDAARPFISAGLVESVLSMTFLQGACIPVLPVGDTVKEIEKGQIVRTIPRESLGLAQTPQGFRREYLEQAYERARRTGFQGTDEASMVEQLGVKIATVTGESRNIKITWREDLKAPQEGTTSG